MTDLHQADKNPDPAKDPDFTIPEDRDRIAEIQESIDELGRALKEACASLTPLFLGLGQSFERAGEAFEKFADGAKVDDIIDKGDREDVVLATSTPQGIADAMTMTSAQHARQGNIRRASQAMALAIKSNLPRTRVVATKPINGGDRLDVVRATGPGGQTSAVVSIYTSGKATTGGKDDALRADLRALLEAEGFDVRC